MSVTDVARAIDDGIARRGVVKGKRRGWLPCLTPYMGYGSTKAVKILARATMRNPKDRKAAVSLDLFPYAPHSIAASMANDFAQKVADASAEAQRGWRQFFHTPVGYLPVTVKIGDQEIHTRTDRGGYLDLLVEDHGLNPGWHQVELIPRAGEKVQAPLLIVAPTARRGVISDVDDTIVITWMPRPFIAVWNALVVHTNARQPVPGMAQLCREVLNEDPHAPIFYLSGGAWNTYTTMVKFLQKNSFPIGPMMLTDWGPTSTGLFRNSEAHKKTQLRNLLLMFPNIEWYLVGDDGQNDAIVYDDLAREHPSRVRAIALRQLNPIEQIFSHWSADPVEPNRADSDTERHGAPVVRGSDGYVLLKKLRNIALAKRSCA